MLLAVTLLQTEEKLWVLHQRIYVRQCDISPSYVEFIYVTMCYICANEGGFMRVD